MLNLKLFLMWVIILRLLILILLNSLLKHVVLCQKISILLLQWLNLFLKFTGFWYATYCKWIILLTKILSINYTSCFPKGMRLRVLLLLFLILIIPLLFLIIIELILLLCYWLTYLRWYLRLFFSASININHSFLHHSEDWVVVSSTYFNFRFKILLRQLLCINLRIFFFKVLRTIYLSFLILGILPRKFKIKVILSRLTL